MAEATLSTPLSGPFRFAIWAGLRLAFLVIKLGWKFGPGEPGFPFPAPRRWAPEEYMDFPAATFLN